MQSLLMFCLALTAACAAMGQAALPKSVNARDFGTVGDGVADDTAAIQKALDAVQGAPGVVHLPAGKFRISATLLVRDGATLLGEGARWENAATQILIMQPGFAAVRLHHASALKGVCLSYPNNRKNVQPVKYPPAILLGGINPAVEDVTFDCAWDGVSTVPGIQTGQSLFRNLTGHIHNVGMHLSGIRDVVRVENVHWFVGGDPIDATAYYTRNRVGFELGDVDGLIMSKCFVIGARTFFHQLPTKDTTDGTKQPAHSLGLHIDQCWIEDVDNGFIFEGTSGFVLESTNILVRKGGVGVRVDADHLFYNAVITGVQVRPFDQPIRGFEYRVKNPHERNRLSIADCQVTMGSPAVRLMKGAIRANIHDSHFKSVPGQPAVQIDEGVTLFTLTNNILTSAVPIRDQSGPKAQKTITGNLVEKP
ncbi:MAG: glycosyl hydrolase family 28-related protein [Armatimonadetes bacterium]|nr:glycosyl hydrolase family 28-related protein [Armatimonadota bacterium]